MFEPFLAPIALAFMTAIVVKPIDKNILSYFKGRRTIAAVFTVLFVMLVILVPLSVMIQQITVEALSFYSDVRSGDIGGFESIIGAVTAPVKGIFPNFNPDVQSFVQSFSDNIIFNASKIFSSTASVALGIFIAIIALFYMLRDGDKFRSKIIELSPLADKYDNDIIDKIEKAVNSVVRGSLFTSLIKGILAAFGFLIFGIPHPFLWGMLTAIVSLLPGIGAGLTIIPAILYLIVQDSFGSAIGLGVWGVIVVGLVDNILMPIVVGKGFTVHPLLVLLSVLGGLAFFGPVGLFLGPLVIALLSALVEIYKIIILDDTNKEKTTV
jgi:predicted PurR-regulated permease PerM